MIISSRKNPAVMLYRELNKERKAREREGKFNIEGAKLCGEAVDAGLVITDAFLTEEAERKYPDIAGKIRDVLDPTMITDDIASYISDTKTPQGIFLTARTLDKNEKTCKIDSMKYILLDGLQDAGNVGTIIRTCDALGIGAVVMSPDCADVYSPKVVRSAMGSLFRLNVMTAPLPCFIAGLQADGYTVYAAVLDKNAESINDVRFPGKCAVVIGNEGSGVSRDVINAAGKSIYIPIENAESLNASVAAAIFCYEMKK